jgi:hypothetical protein
MPSAVEQTGPVVLELIDGHVRDGEMSGEGVGDGALLRRGCNGSGTRTFPLSRQTPRAISIEPVKR